MRLLTRKEVDRDTKTRENRDMARLNLVNEELARKENILNQVVDNVDSNKEKILRDFESFKQEFIERKGKLHSQIIELEQRKGVLEIQTIRETSKTLALNDLESKFLKKKKQEEDLLKQREVELRHKEEELFSGLKDYAYKTEYLNEKVNFIDTEGKRLQDKKQEFQEKSEQFEVKKQELEFQSKQDNKDVGDRELKVETGRASNEVVKDQIHKEWDDLEKGKLDFTQEKNSIRDSLRETKQRDRQLESQESHNKKIQSNLEDEWKKMERERLSLREKQDSFKKVEDKLQEEVKDFQNTKVSHRLEKQNIEQEQRDLKNANIKLKDERAILDSAWRELKTK